MAQAFACASYAPMMAQVFTCAINKITNFTPTYQTQFMSEKFKFHDQHGLFFVSFSVVNWIDVFIREEYKDILLSSWKYCQKAKNLTIHSWCIMSSHVHMIISSQYGNISGIIRDMKRHTSVTIRNAIETNPHESRKEWMLSLMKQAGE